MSDLKSTKDPIVSMDAEQRIAKSPKKPHRKLKITGIVLVSLILLVGIAAVWYVMSLAGLVKPPEFTGNPSLAESDIIETDDPNETDSEPGGTVNPSESTLSSEDLENIEKEHEGEAGQIAIPSDPDVYNILLIGTDNRGNEKNGRSDAMIILSVNKRTHKIHLASLMRALYVKIPDHGYSLLNASFSWGGFKLLQQTIEDNFRLHLDDYLLIDFGGFTDAVDTIGGVSIDLTSAEAKRLSQSYPKAGLHTGINELDGEIALAYSRLRKLDSDFMRTGRQRNVIEALIRKTSSLSLLQIDALAREILPLVKSNRTGTSILTLAAEMYGYRNYPISQLMIPLDGTYKKIMVRNAEMEQFDVKTNIEALHQFLYKD
ncbi:MAG: LCP family protein [Clostridiaceae bacterium]|nr:LCP family protein [Clostridiaceae bacterium]